MTSRTAQRKAKERGEVDRPGVVVGYPTAGAPHALFVQSLMGTILTDPKLRIVRYGGHIQLISGPRVGHARCEIIQHFLDDFEFSRADWLWLLDDDMVFDPDVLPKLLAAADPVERPIMGALCFAGGIASQVFPTLYKFISEDGALATVFDYPPDTVCKTEATGAACLLVHRSVLHRMRLAFGATSRGPNPYPWFTEGMVTKSGHGIGEDIAFCLRCRQLDIPIHVHTGAKVGHVKEMVVDENAYAAQRYSTAAKAG